MTTTTLDGKVALVTGGSRGIGAAIATRLADAGADVALTYVNSADKANDVARQIEFGGRRALAIQADSSDPQAVIAAVEQTVTALGRIDILINNAGIFIAGPLDGVTVEQLDSMWNVDVRAVFVASQAASRHMGEGGRIITIGSALADHLPSPGMTVYAMCKSALAGLTKGLARDLAPKGITVCVVQGGLIDTDMNPADSPVAEVMRSIPALGRYGTAAEITGLIAFLASDESSYVTGTTINVDGGFAT